MADPILTADRVKEGDALPRLSIDVKPVDIVLGAMASRDWRPQHHDYKFATERNGVPRPDAPQSLDRDTTAPPRAALKPHFTTWPTNWALTPSRTLHAAYTAKFCLWLQSSWSKPPGSNVGFCSDPLVA